MKIIILNVLILSLSISVMISSNFPDGCEVLTFHVAILTGLTLLLTLAITINHLSMVESHLQIVNTSKFSIRAPIDIIHFDWFENLLHDCAWEV